MNELTFNSRMETYKLGTYVSMVWQSVHGAYTKISKGVVRITNKNIWHTKDNIPCVRLRITKNAKMSAKIIYLCNGVKITKEEYDSNNKSMEIKDYFSKHLSDIISIK